MGEILSDDDPRKRLWDQLVLLRNASDEFHYLFAGPSERRELLRRTAPWFFDYVSRQLASQLILGISRLTDPHTMGAHRNLTLAVLLEDPKLDSVLDLRAEVESAIEEIRKLATPVREHRHKTMAHLDHDVAVNAPGAELPQLSNSLIENCLSAMERVYNLVGGKVHGTGTVFELSARGDAKSLVTALEDAQKWRNAEMQRLRKEHGLSPGADS